MRAKFRVVASTAAWGSIAAISCYGLTALALPEIAAVALSVSAFTNMSCIEIDHLQTRIKPQDLIIREMRSPKINF